MQVEKRIVKTEELAEILRYDQGVSSAFWVWMKRIGAKPLPGRSGCWDLEHVFQCISASQQNVKSSIEKKHEGPKGLVQLRRARLGKA